MMAVHNKFGYAEMRVSLNIDPLSFKHHAVIKNLLYLFPADGRPNIRKSQILQ